MRYHTLYVKLPQAIPQIPLNTIDAYGGCIQLASEQSEQDTLSTVYQIEILVYK